MPTKTKARRDRRDQSQEQKRQADEDGLAAELDEKTEIQMINQEIARLTVHDREMRGQSRAKIAQKARENVAARLHPEPADDEQEDEPLDPQTFYERAASKHYERLASDEMLMKGMPVADVLTEADRLAAEEFGIAFPGQPIPTTINVNGAFVDDDEQEGTEKTEPEDDISDDEWNAADEDFGNEEERQAARDFGMREPKEEPQSTPSARSAKGAKKERVAALGKPRDQDKNQPPAENCPSANLDDPTDPRQQTLMVLRVQDIAPYADQPRKHFDQTKLAELAQLIRSGGFIQNIKVRPTHTNLGKPRYEIVDGERRWRAAKIAGLAEMPCIVQEMSDAEAIEQRGVAGITNESLNPIERAGWYQQMCRPKEEGGGGYTQTALAEKYQLSQPAIANAIRLLKLPESIQDLVIRQEITPAHAAAIVPYTEHLEIVEHIAQQVRKDVQRGDVQNAKDFADDLVRDVGNFQSLTGDEHTAQGSIHWEIRPTAEEAAELRLIDVKPWPGASAKEKVQIALNTKLWRKLKALAIVEAKEGRKPKPRTKNAKQKAPTPAETKANAARDKKRFQIEVDDFKVSWLSYLCHQKLTEYRAKSGDGRPGIAVIKLLLHLCIETPLILGFAEFDDAIEAARLPKRATAQSAFSYLSSVTSEKLASLALHLILRLLWNPQPKLNRYYDHEFTFADLEELARSLNVDRQAAWRKERCGPLTEEFYELHDIKQLEGLAKEHRCQFFNLSKAEMIKGLIAVHVHPPLPKVLWSASPKKAKQKAAKAAKKKGTKR